MELLPDELLLDIHRRAPFLASICKSGRALWLKRAVTRLTTEGADEDPEHFMRFVKDLARADAQVCEVVLHCPVSAAVLWSTGYASRQLLQGIRRLEVDVRILDAFRWQCNLEFEYEELVVRIQHVCENGDVIDLTGIKAHSVSVFNEDWMPSEDPSMDWGVYYEAQWRKKPIPMLIGVSARTETLEVCGAISCGGALMGGRGLQRLVCDGCVLAGPLPAGLLELEITSARTLRSPNTIIGGCCCLRRLHLDNMYVFASRIPEELWDAWAKTMEYYADEGSTCCLVDGTCKLASAKEFYISLSFTGNRTNYRYRIPHSSVLQKVRVERIVIYPEDVGVLDACPSVELVDCQYFMH